MALLSELCEYEVMVLIAMLDGGNKETIEDSDGEVQIIKGTTTWNRLKQVQNFTIEEAHL